jgi:hypothetical protein
LIWTPREPGYFAHEKSPNPVGPSQDPRYGPTVGFYGVVLSYERGPLWCVWFAGTGFDVQRNLFTHLGGNPGANLKSISHRCHSILVAFVWELTQATINLPLGCLQGGLTTPESWNGLPKVNSLCRAVVFKCQVRPPRALEKRTTTCTKKRPLFAARRWILWSWRTVLKLTCSKFGARPVTLERNIARPQQIGEPPKTVTKHGTGLKTSTFHYVKLDPLNPKINCVRFFEDKVAMELDPSCGGAMIQ